MSNYLSKSPLSLFGKGVVGGIYQGAIVFYSVRTLGNCHNAGKLQFRDGSIYGYPYLRLLRSEVEKLAEEKFGKDALLKNKAKTELKKINSELKTLKLKIEELEERKKNWI